MADFDNDVFFASIPELQAAIRARKFTAVELARAVSDRLEKLGPRYNALALSLREEAIREAHAADGDFLRGRIRSALQGIPYGVKDLVAVARHPTTWGAKPYAAQVFDTDATVVRKLRSAGSVLTAKLAMVELAGGGGYRFANASLQGPGLNPWDRSCWSGGSSSGSGSAVAAGLVPFALGSETSGSIITPAAYCGITGLRPTYGLVSRAGCMALSWTLDKIGPMARSAEDCALVLSVISGGDGDDPMSAGKRFYYTPQFAPQMKDLRIGYRAEDFTDGVMESARPAFAEALAAVRSLGVTLVETRLPDFPYGPLVSTIISGEAASIFEELISSGKVEELADKRQIAGLKLSLELPARDYLRAMRIRRLVQEAFAKLFIDVDMLLAPSRTGPANKISEPLDARRGPAGSPLIPATNLTGYPAISLPCGFADNLPVGIQFIGLPFTENKLIAVGKAFQTATDWHKRRPPV